MIEAELLGVWTKSFGVHVAAAWYLHRRQPLQLSVFPKRGRDAGALSAMVTVMRETAHLQGLSQQFVSTADLLLSCEQRRQHARIPRAQHNNISTFASNMRHDTGVPDQAYDGPLDGLLASNAPWWEIPYQRCRAC